MKISFIIICRLLAERKLCAGLQKLVNELHSYRKIKLDWLIFQSDVAGFTLQYTPKLKPNPPMIYTQNKRKQGKFL